VAAEESDGWSKDDCKSAAVVGRDEVACVENEASLRGVDTGIRRNNARWHIARPPELSLRRYIDGWQLKSM